MISVITITLMSSCQKAASLVEQRNCRQQLRSVWAGIALYRHDHGEHWPPNLESLDQEAVGRLLTCPGVKVKVSSHTTGKYDYIFLDWSKLTHGPDTAPSNYPLMYDRRMSNHDGRGINILMVDGSVKWDSHAEWLKRFAADHPDFIIPISK